MTISTTSNTTVQQGNGLTTTFDFTFPVPLASELFVYFTDTTGAITLLSPSTYSVSGVGTPNGGTVTYPLVGSPIATGTSLTIQRVLPYHQLTSLVNQSGYYPNVVENALDYLTMLCQQLAESASLSLQVPFSSGTQNLVYPSSSGRANKLAGFDANGNAAAYPITASVGAGNLTVEGPFVAGTNFIPGVTTSLILSQAYGSVSNVSVHFDGIYQGTDQYTLNGTQITFTSPIPTGTAKVYIVGGTTLSLGVPGNGSVGTLQLVDGSVTSAKIAVGAVGTTQLAGRIIGDAQIAWGGILNRVCDSIAALSALDPTVYTRSFVMGYYAPGDGGGGAYYYSASTSQTLVNGGTVIAASGGTGCWLLSYSGALSVMQFGAKGDGVTDDAAAINAALTNASSKVTLPALTFRVASTINVPAGKFLHGAVPMSYANSSGSGPCIIGDLSLSTIVSATSGATTEGAVVKDVVVTRAAGSVPANSVGVAFTNSNDTSVLEDVMSLRSYIGFDVGDGVTTSLGLHLHRCYTGQITGYHVKIINVVEATFSECRFGRNGGVDVSCGAYVDISGSTVDTVRFLTCQFNLSGGQATKAIQLTSYTDVNGIISFEQCHAEQFGDFFAWDTGSSGINRVKICNCTIDSASAGTLLFGNSATLSNTSIVGNTCINTGLTLDQQTNSIVTGNYFGLATVINQGSQVVTGNIFAGAVTLEGVAVKSVFVGNSCGSLGNTMTGNTVVASNG